MRRELNSKPGIAYSTAKPIKMLGPSILKKR
jgi:hypothetical protein